MLVSHRTPVKPHGQVHTNELILGCEQTPPFLFEIEWRSKICFFLHEISNVSRTYKQGPDAQLLRIVWQLAPVKPNGHWPIWMTKVKIMKIGRGRIYLYLRDAHRNIQAELWVHKCPRCNRANLRTSQTVVHSSLHNSRAYMCICEM